MAPNPNPNPKQEWHGAAKTGQLACLERLLAAEPWLLQARYLVITPTSLAARCGAVAAAGTLPSYHPYQPRLLQALSPNPSPNPNLTRTPTRTPTLTLLQNRSENAAEQQLGNTALHWAAAHGQARYLVITPTPRCTGPRRTGRFTAVEC